MYKDNYLIYTQDLVSSQTETSGLKILVLLTFNERYLINRETAIVHGSKSSYKLHPSGGIDVSIIR